VLFIFSLVVLVAEVLEEEAPPLRITQIDVPPPREEQPKLQREVTESQLTVDIVAESESDKPSPISQLDVPIEDAAQREEDSDNPEPKGREEAVADAETGGQGAFMAIGAGGGSSGMLGSRSGGGKKRALGRFGGNQASESAVDAALRWFKKHQSEDGRWDIKQYVDRCSEQPKCEPGFNWMENSTADYIGGGGIHPETAHIACTAYAVLCYLGAGYDHRMPSKYRDTVRRGIDYLVKSEGADGKWVGPGYTQGAATMALAEAYAMSADPGLKESAQKAVDAIIAWQTKDDPSYPGYEKPADAAYASDGLGWDYIVPNPARIDSSVSGWMTMALKSAKVAGLDTKNALGGVKTWVTRAWKCTNPDWRKLTDPYKDESNFPYVFSPKENIIPITFGQSGMAGENQVGEYGNLAPVAALCLVFLGTKSGDIMLETLCNYIMNHQFPTAYPTNTYRMYYNTLAIFQMGGERWNKWNATVRDMLVKAQRVGNGCFDGSWDFEGTKWAGWHTGRLASTALCCLSLEVYYRYLPVAARGKR
jgi:hypothetical protein